MGILCLLLLAAGGSWSDALDMEAGTVWVNSNQSVTVPCGDVESSQDISRMYYMRDTGYILANSTNEELTTNISLSDINKQICCLVDDAIFPEPQEYCYNIMESYAPRFSDMSGYREPVFGQHFQMECPLEGSPPTIYYWQKYESIDMATETNFTTDVQFVDGGRIWYVDVVTAKLSGMYVCRAENEKGTEVYVDVMNFFLSVSACPYHAPEVSVQIVPAGINSYRKGDSVELLCTAVAVEQHQQPFWWKEHDDGPMTLCTMPEYILNSSFEKSACRWTTVLTIPEFVSENTGIYHCTSGYDGTNTTLHLDDLSGEGYLLSIISVIAVMLVSVLFTPELKSRIELLQHTREPPHDGFMYDAFISAHDEVKNIVLDSILQPLESSPSLYRLCWHSRDFLPGIPIMEQIARAMAKSRKIIFVFSEHFLQSEFCRVELKLAMNRYMRSCTRCIIPVTLADEHVPKQLRQTVTYLPILSTGESNVSEEITKVMGQPIPVMVERLNDSFVEE